MASQYDIKLFKSIKITRILLIDNLTNHLDRLFLQIIDKVGHIKHKVLFNRQRSDDIDTICYIELMDMSKMPLFIHLLQNYPFHRRDLILYPWDWDLNKINSINQITPLYQLEPHRCNECENYNSYLQQIENHIINRRFNNSILEEIQIQYETACQIAFQKKKDKKNRAYQPRNPTPHFYQHQITPNNHQSPLYIDLNQQTPPTQTLLPSRISQINPIPSLVDQLLTIQIITTTQDITSNIHPSSTTSQQIQPQSPTLIGIRKLFCDSPQPHSPINIDCLFNSTFHETHPNKSTRWNPSTGRDKPFTINF